MATTNELSMKLLIDTKSQKVCFAEAGSDVVEFLSGLLSLPLGTVTTLLTKERMVGSIGNVVGSMEKLDANYKSKELRLSPEVGPAMLSRLQQLLSAQLTNGDVTHRNTRNSYNEHSSEYAAAMLAPARAYGNVAPAAAATTTVLPASTYTVRDDLSVTPASFFTTIPMLGITRFAQCGVKDFSVMQEKTVKIGKEEALGILATSLKSKTVLTDVFLPKKNARCKREPPEEVIQL
ncbi:hypothetical protein CFC21_034143 [Triticum aestivum]|uniref:Uncharacterized protein n=4 Tax=Triticum TaxID=4564 RepID=A0A9R0RCE6_TRITD|nr:uncharacterized protein LOC123057872 [Triticum aestivum]XP_048566777.1 uncharacterized protein LOC125546643 [Triticum urartu]KAF7021150.1 hypothetical protein CFC21_034143 [Triticum aestivum]VAH57287.1 unnamed protein product [Triticum turgidum subsp. durum]